jgi:hypothetical protein
MPLFAAALVVARRNRRTTTMPVPVNAPPLWWLLADEIAHAARRLRARLAALVSTRSPDRRQG